MQPTADNQFKEKSEASLFAENIAPLAIVGSDEFWCEKMAAELEEFGFKIDKFASLDNLWRSIFCGEAFSALIKKENSTINPSILPGTFAKAANMVLILHASNFKMLASGAIAFPDTEFDFASSSASAEEFHWRLRKLFRNSATDKSSPNHQITVGDYHFDWRNNSAKIRSTAIDLTFVEFNIATLLFKNYNSIVNSQQISSIMNRNFSSGSKSLAVHMTRLRNKLSLRGEYGVTLRAIYGRGYTVQFLSP